MYFNTKGEDATTTVVESPRQNVVGIFIIDYKLTHRIVQTIDKFVTVFVLSFRDIMRVAAQTLENAVPQLKPIATRYFPKFREAHGRVHIPVQHDCQIVG